MACKYIYESKEYTKEEFYKFVGDNLVEKKSVPKYTKILFPSGNTASKVEGHTTLEEFKKQKEDRIKELELLKSNPTSFKEIQEQGATLEGIAPFGLIGTQQEVYDASKSKEAYDKFIVNRNNKFHTEINQLKQELERVEKEGFGALKPIYNFYENTVTNILKKNYQVNKITDEYGNTWNEIIINSIDNITQEDIKKLPDCI